MRSAEAPPAIARPPALTPSRLRIRVRGAVQGVGFRPFVYHLATAHDLSGFVLNDGDGVLVEVEGRKLDAFVTALKHRRPPLARIDTLDLSTLPAKGSRGFAIRESLSGAARTRVIPDAATCDACLEELFDPTSRFHLYPFVTCTHCGPRFSITRRLPYDRAQTAMAGFPLCEACARDYAAVSSRRFHAETIACPVCGPRLSHPIEAVAAAVKTGRIVALKGIGGFHLICDAFNEAAVAELRRRKAREEKPFAVMVANDASVDSIAAPADDEYALLSAGERPIVLMRGRQALAPSVAPGLTRIGVMLPYAPVHHLLFHALAGHPADPGWQRRPQPFALVATSANPGGEPLVIDDDDAAVRLDGIADLIVTHDRPIVTRADDSVMAVIDGAPAYLRRSRGFVPAPIDLGEDGPATLAVGAHLKATITVTRGREAFVSQHVGDLDNAATIRFHQETVRHFIDILDVRPEAVACDLHPDFHSTRFAEASGLPVIAVQHHAAHIAAVAAEHGVRGPVLGLALDGHGAGDDGGAWGGELICLDGSRWRRLGHLLPLALPGGDRATRQPWRMGIAALAALGRIEEAARLFPDVPLAPRLPPTLANAPTTTSAGRLFDAAAALLGLRTRVDYEGQAAIELEALADNPEALPGGFRVEGDVLDFRPLLAVLPSLRHDPSAGADLFHGTLIAGLAAWTAAAASRFGLTQVAFGGGCFMNRVLAEGLAGALRARGLVPLLPRAVPANDGGLSLGQAHVARMRLAGKDSSCASPYPCA
ncbi:MAG TPA: carbamoyltransferase HypF [Rhodopila sp.]|uniref:carbamoyltransferase HypF n=1 Tax=Rhodopila sp. TaxID=2480087 RepID=UPI002CC2549D|nr:carbamoyltransferase HypF [Rhodopila sp.]HVY15128.1 carbamoyltransferase HypF [Rhodopila sp.]